MLSKVLKSKTMWLAAAVAVLPQIGAVVEAVAPLLGDSGQAQAQNASLVIAALIAAARALTRKPLSEK